MKLLILLLAAAAQVISEDLPLSKYFFPGDPPKLVEGVLKIQGHFLESELPPMALPPNFRLGQTFRSNMTKSSARRRAGSKDTEARSVIPRNFGLPPLGQVSTVLYADPPVCVACYCLQEYKSCLDAGGVQLVTVNTTNTDYTLPTFVSEGLTCSQNTVNDYYYYYSDITTVTCIKTPSASLSACDVACRSNTDACQGDPSYDNCPQISQPSVCGTACASLKINMTVPCTPTAPGVISARPTTACTSLKKREAIDSAPPSSHIRAPQLESSIGKPSRSATGRGFIAAVITKRVPGKVTATYVAQDAACLPSNILSSPNCK